MANVPDPPSSANAPPHVDLADPAARAQWLAAMRAQAADATAAGLDATAPPARRELGRRAARRIITEADRAIGALLAAADLEGKGEAKRTASGATSTPKTSTAPHDEHDEHDDTDATIGEAWDSVLRFHDRLDEMQAAPLTLLLAAVTGTPGERGEIDPVSITILRTVRASLDAWLNAPSDRTIYAVVPLVDLDLLVRRVDAAIGLARDERRALASGGES